MGERERRGEGEKGEREGRGRGREGGWEVTHGRDSDQVLQLRTIVDRSISRSTSDFIIPHCPRGGRGRGKEGGRRGKRRGRESGEREREREGETRCRVTRPKYEQPNHQPIATSAIRAIRGRPDH